MAKVLLSVRIPDELMHQIDIKATETKRDKTSITIELLERGLETLGTAPIESANFVPVERFEEAIANLTADLEKKSQPDPASTKELIREQVKALVKTEIGDLNKKVIKLMLDVDALKASSGGGVEVKNEVIPQSHPGQLNLLSLEPEPVAKVITINTESDEGIDKSETDDDSPKTPEDENAKGISGVELSNYFGLKSRSSVSDAVKEGSEYFYSWSATKDPDHKPWKFEGEGKTRKFFRIV